MSLFTNFTIILALFCITVSVKAKNLTLPQANVPNSFFVFDSKIELTGDNVQARVNDILYCSVNSISIPQSQEIQTKTSEPYQYIPAPAEGCIRFRVLATHTGNIALTTDTVSTMPTYSIVLGGWWNTKSGIFTSNGRAQTIVNTPNILNSSEYREFWMEWNSNMIRLGREGDSRNFMILNDPNHPRINLIGFATSEVSGNWVVKNPEPNCFASHKLNVEASCSL